VVNQLYEEIINMTSLNDEKKSVVVEKVAVCSPDFFFGYDPVESRVVYFVGVFLNFSKRLLSYIFGLFLPLHISWPTRKFYAIIV